MKKEHFQINAIKDKQQRCFLAEHVAWVENAMRNILT